MLKYTQILSKMKRMMGVIMSKKGKHFTWDNRLQIEAWLKAGVTKTDIAGYLGRHLSNVGREIKRGLFMKQKEYGVFVEVYAAEVAQGKYEAHLKAKGPDLKIGKDIELANYIEDKIVNHKYSPEAALMAIVREGKKFKTTICTTTLYSYIGKDVFAKITNKHLVVKSARKKDYKRVKKRAKPPRGESIEDRPEEINNRETFGHWECDSVEGKKGKGKRLIVLTERLTRQEVILPVADGTAESMVGALDVVEKRWGGLFSHVFKSITVDNGSEFTDYKGIEESKIGIGEMIEGVIKRTKVFCCHPYASWERGSNEVQNKLIRYHIPKGTPIENYTDDEVAYIETWINEYPRRIFGGRASVDLFNEEVERIRQSLAVA